MNQRQLNLTVSARTALVSVPAVRLHLGVDAETVLARIDAGEYRWVFDVSAAPRAEQRVRELRVWARELVQPESVRGLTVAEAIQGIIGGRERYYGTELGQLLMVSRPQIFRLHHRRALPGAVISGRLWVAREALVTFLTARLVGAEVQICHNGNFAKGEG